MLAPNGDLIASNGDGQDPNPNDVNELVEFTPKGVFVGKFQIDSGAPGAAFGIAISSDGAELRFAAVDDNTNAVTIWTFQQKHHNHESHSELDALGFWLAESMSQGRHSQEVW